MEESFTSKLINNLLQDKRLEGVSRVWANWMSELSVTTCMHCAENHGKIISIFSFPYTKHVNAHTNCRCVFVPMRTKKVGTATNKGYSGADAHIFYLNKLPSYYISKKEAYKLGWKTKSKHLNNILPGKMIGGDVF